jgi:hypothetical protein
MAIETLQVIPLLRAFSIDKAWNRDPGFRLPDRRYF